MFRNLCQIGNYTSLVRLDVTSLKEHRQKDACYLTEVFACWEAFETVSGDFQHFWITAGSWCISQVILGRNFQTKVHVSQPITKSSAPYAMLLSLGVLLQYLPDCVASYTGRIGLNSQRLQIPAD